MQLENYNDKIVLCSEVIANPTIMDYLVKSLWVATNGLTSTQIVVL
jgi:hypothetical protein